MNFADLLSSFSFVIGWFVVVVAICYFIPSILLGGFFLLVSLLAIASGGFLIWISKRI